MRCWGLLLLLLLLLLLSLQFLPALSKERVSGARPVLCLREAVTAAWSKDRRRRCRSGLAFDNSREHKSGRWASRRIHGNAKK